MYLFIDTETNGLPKQWDAKAGDVDNWPRITDLAFALYDGAMNELERHRFLIAPDGWEIPDEPFFRDKGYTTEANAQDGHPISSGLSRLCLVMSRAQFFIAHNTAFDVPVVGAEMIRAKIFPANKLQKFCTMRATTSYMRLPARNGGSGYKFPSLSELHRHLFHEDFEETHTATADVQATARCFKELMYQRVIGYEEGQLTNENRDYTSHF